MVSCPGDLADEVKVLRKQLEADRLQGYLDKVKSLSDMAPTPLKIALKITAEKGASSWVSAAPSYDHDTVLSKGDFLDAVYLGMAGPTCPMPARAATLAPLTYSMHLIVCAVDIGQYNTMKFAMCWLA